MRFNEFQSMMHDLWGKGHSPEQIAIRLICDYLWDYTKDRPLCNTEKFAQSVQNTLRC